MGAADPRYTKGIISKYHTKNDDSTLRDNSRLFGPIPQKAENPRFYPRVRFSLSTVYRLYSCHDTTQDNPRQNPNITQATTKSEAYPETSTVQSFMIIMG